MDDQIGVDPLIVMPPADRGGLTPTIALDAASPAIDRVPNAACPPTDQRGQPRPYSSTTSERSCDVGAYEWRPASP